MLMKKKNGADKYDFLREPWSWDSKNFVKLCFIKFLLRSPAECPASRNIIFRLYRFSFHKPIKSRLVRGRLYLPLQALRKHRRICDTTPIKLRFKGEAVFPDKSQNISEAFLYLQSSILLCLFFQDGSGRLLQAATYDGRWSRQSDLNI